MVHPQFLDPSHMAWFGERLRKELVEGCGLRRAVDSSSLPGEGKPVIGAVAWALVSCELAVCQRSTRMSLNRQLDGKVDWMWPMEAARASNGSSLFGRSLALDREMIHRAR